jgi:hypothetical protein
MAITGLARFSVSDRSLDISVVASSTVITISSSLKIQYTFITAFSYSVVSTVDANAAAFVAT